MTALPEEELRRLHELQAVGVVATTRRDGWPHLVPVWYLWADAAVNVWTSDTRLWVRNARRDPRVAFSVQENGPPFSAVLIRGEAEVLDDTWPGFAKTVRAITARYVPAGGVEPYIAEWAKLRTLVRIHPLHALGWGRGY
jgi:PPOX class probable F420-dependent enzyme